MGEQSVDLEIGKPGDHLHIFYRRNVVAVADPAHAGVYRDIALYDDAGCRCSLGYGFRIFVITDHR